MSSSLSVPLTTLEAPILNCPNGSPRGTAGRAGKDQRVRVPVDDFFQHQVSDLDGGQRWRGG